jgi:hypothetical protein
MNKQMILILFLLLCAGIYAQERGGIVVNKYRHTPLLLNIYANALYGNATSSQISSAVSAAYSLRRVNLYYSGPLIQISDANNTTYDIGYNSNNDLDIVYLSAVVGNKSWYVVKWYDQSGNSNHLMQGDKSLQPQIVSSGVVNSDGTNSRPALKFTTTDNTSTPPQEMISPSMSIQSFVGVRRAFVSTGGTSSNPDDANMQYFVCVPADNDVSIRSSSTYGTNNNGNNSSKGVYGDGNAGDFWNSGTIYVNNAYTSQTPNYPTGNIHSVYAFVSTAINSTFSLSSGYKGISTNKYRGLYTKSSTQYNTVSELFVFPATLSVVDRNLIYNNQKSYYGF